MKQVTVATSITPNNIENQRKAINSWKKYGFHVVSINAQEEINEIQSHFSDIEFVLAKRDGREKFGKPYIYFDDFLEYFKQSNCQVCGIVNSDISFIAENNFKSIILEYATNSLVCGYRTDVETLENLSGKINEFGFDYFFFDRAIISLYPKEDFCVGLPWWDYWAVLIPLVKGIPVKEVVSSVAFRIIQPLNCNEQFWSHFGYILAKYVRTPIGLTPETMVQLSHLIMQFIREKSQRFLINGIKKVIDNSSDKKYPKVSLLLSTYKSERFLAQWLASITQQTIWDQIELIICSNDPSQEEKNIINYFAEFWQDQVKVIYVPRETLYASWNRCIEAAATSDYFAIANVDDIRTPGSLEMQLQTLENNRDVLFCYGPITVVNRFPSQMGVTFLARDFDQLDFTRRMMVGPFLVWRRTNNPAIQYFDEQFKSGGDYDFAIRLALHGKGIKVDNLLGYYYNGGTGLSTGGELMPIERTVIELRYGIFDNIDYNYLPQASEYQITLLSQQGEIIGIDEFVPNYEAFIGERYKKWFMTGVKRDLNRRAKVESHSSS